RRHLESFWGISDRAGARVAAKLRRYATAASTRGDARSCTFAASRRRRGSKPCAEGARIETLLRRRMHRDCAADAWIAIHHATRPVLPRKTPCMQPLERGLRIGCVNITAVTD